MVTPKNPSAKHKTRACIKREISVFENPAIGDLINDFFASNIVITLLSVFLNYMV